METQAGVEPLIPPARKHATQKPKGVKQVVRVTFGSSLAISSGRPQSADRDANQSNIPVPD